MVLLLVVLLKLNKITINKLFAIIIVYKLTITIAITSVYELQWITIIILILQQFRNWNQFQSTFIF